MAKTKNNHVIWHDGYVTRKQRLQKYGHRSGIVWFTGLSASGKSTIAHRLERILFEKGVKTYALDGDNVRHGINSDLGFSPEERRENLRRIAELSRLFVDAGDLKGQYKKARAGIIKVLIYLMKSRKILTS